MSLACEVLRASPSTHRRTLSLLVHFLVEAEADSSGFEVHNCVEALATDLGSALVPVALAATAGEARAWWKRFKGDVGSMFDFMALARASFSRPFAQLGATSLPGLEAGIADPDPFIRAEAAAFLASLGPVAQPALSIMKKALVRERSAWARYEMQQATDSVGALPRP